MTGHYPETPPTYPDGSPFITLPEELNPGDDPLKEHLYPGYDITRAVLDATKYLTRAIDGLEPARLATNEHIGYEAIQSVDLNSIRNKLYRALAGLQLAEKAHKEGAQMLHELGFRRVNTQDFRDAELGVRPR